MGQIDPILNVHTVYIYKALSKRSFFFSELVLFSLLLQGPNPKFPLLHCNLISHLSPGQCLFLPEGRTRRVEQHLLSAWTAVSVLTWHIRISELIPLTVGNKSH